MRRWEYVESYFFIAKPRPQTDEFVCVYQIFCLRRRDARCWMLDACCSESEIPSLAGIKIFPFTAPGDIINFLYRPFRKIKKAIKFLISSSIQNPVSLHYLRHSILKLGSKFTILAYIDG
jgi:hypothetical protein